MRGSDRFVSRKLKSFDRTLYWEHEGNQAARRGRWKLVPKYPGQHELYGIEADRTELRDRAGTNRRFWRSVRVPGTSGPKTPGILPWEQVEKSLHERST